jgi:hypothetical protein
MQSDLPRDGKASPDSFIILLYEHQVKDSDDIQNFPYSLPRIGAVMDWALKVSNWKGWSDPVEFCNKFDKVAAQYDKYYEKLPIKPHEVSADFEDLTSMEYEDEGDTFAVEDVDDTDGLS